MRHYTKAEVLEVQKNWAAAIAHISKVHKEGGDYIAAAGEAAGNLYAYGHSEVLFKPTKAAKFPFRPTATEAMSLFLSQGFSTLSSQKFRPVAPRQITEAQGSRGPQCFGG